MKPILTFYSTLVFTLCLTVSGHCVIADDQLAFANIAVYVKVVLPVKPLPGESHPVVESWIAKRLKKFGKSDFRAVTHWVCLAGKDEQHTKVWAAMVDGNLWGCPVNGKFVEQTEDGKLKVDFVGWSPAGAEIKGQLLACEVGSRGIARVDTGVGDDSGLAYVAMLVGPALANKDLAEKLPANTLIK